MRPTFRRQLFAAAFATLALAAIPAHAQEPYPAKPIRVVVPYTPASGDTAARDAALAALHAGTAQRWQLRSLQRYLVQAPRRDVDAWLARGDVAEPLPGWFVLQDPTRYDARRGLLRDGAVLDARTLAQ